MDYSSSSLDPKPENGNGVHHHEEDNDVMEMPAVKAAIHPPPNQLIGADSPIPEEKSPSPAPEEKSPSPIPEEKSPSPAPEEKSPSPVPEEEEKEPATAFDNLFQNPFASKKSDGDDKGKERREKSVSPPPAEEKSPSPPPPMDDDDDPMPPMDAEPASEDPPPMPDLDADSSPVKKLEEIEEEEEEEEEEEIILIDGIPQISDEEYYKTNVRQEELEWYDEHGPSEEKIKKTLPKCTACNKQMNLHGGNLATRHPRLGVAICQRCKDFYASGEWTKDEEGFDSFCRWCAQGGELLVCDKCPHAFCKRCLQGR